LTGKALPATIFPLSMKKPFLQKQLMQWVYPKIGESDFRQDDQTLIKELRAKIKSVMCYPSSDYFRATTSI